MRDIYRPTRLPQRPQAVKPSAQAIHIHLHMDSPAGEAKAKGLTPQRTSGGLFGQRKLKIMSSPDLSGLKMPRLAGQDLHYPFYKSKGR